MKKYEKYKDTGIEWIGKIPEHWDCYNLKYVLRENVKDGPHETPIWVDNGIPFLSIDGIVNGELCFDNCRYIDEEHYARYSKKLVIEENDIFIGKAASIGKIARVKTALKFTVWSPIAVIKVAKQYSPIFFEYLFKSDLIQYQIEILSTSNTQKNIAMGDIPKIKIISPTLSEQTQIANYLDKKTAQIDDLIAKKEKLIELLKEERTATINQAVTKGIWSLSGVETPNVPMKDSGIEWLGEIPEHWSVKKIKYVAYLKSGDNIISEQINDSGEYPVYGGNGIRGFFNEFTHDGNYVLIGRQGALCGNIKYAIGKFWASEHAVVSHLLNGENWIWFGKLLETMNLNQYSQSAAQPGLAVTEIKNLYIPYPNISEQNKLATLIFNEEKRIETLIENTSQQIELLKEYKTALISEVVTGKVDVRDEKIN